MKRLPQLDGIRGIAISLVLVWHFFVMQIQAEPGSLLSYLRLALGLTWSGVDLFFVLSGFLIAGILIDQRGAANFFRLFYIRRVCRIFPLYFLVLLSFVCAKAIVDVPSEASKWLFDGAMPLWSYATFTQNIFMGLREGFGANWLGITWSLAIEEQFYLAVPFLVFLFSRKTVFYIFALAVVAAPLLRYVWPGFHTFVGTPWRADSLLIGACLAIMVRSPKFMVAMDQNKQFLFAAFVALVLGTGLLTLRPTMFGVFDHLWLACLYSALILVALVQPVGTLGDILRSRILVWLGTLSYGIYMLHQSVSGLLHWFLRGTAPGVSTLRDAGVTLSALAVTLALAALSYRYLEAPFLALGHRLRFTQKLSGDESTSSPHLVAPVTCKTKPSRGQFTGR